MVDWARENLQSINKSINPTKTLTHIFKSLSFKVDLGVGGRDEVENDQGSDELKQADPAGRVTGPVDNEQRTPHQDEGNPGHHPTLEQARCRTQSTLGTGSEESY